MRPAYGAEEIGIGGHLVTIVVDVANVMGSRPDGWWRDRAGAAARLHAQVVRLAASGRAVLPDEPAPAPAEPAPEPAGPHDGAWPDRHAGLAPVSPPGFVMVFEGAARAAVARLGAAAESRDDGEAAEGAGATGLAAAGAVRPGEVRVVAARGSGDDAIVAVVRELPGRRVVVTADRELRRRCVAVGATIAGPGWLLGLLGD